MKKRSFSRRFHKYMSGNIPFVGTYTRTLKKESLLKKKIINRAKILTVVRTRSEWKGYDTVGVWASNWTRVRSTPCTSLEAPHGARSKNGFENAIGATRFGNSTLPTPLKAKFVFSRNTSGIRWLWAVRLGSVHGFESGRVARFRATRFWVSI